MANNFKYDISKCADFQKKTVENIYRKFYDENKNKVVLADEVGMGKTYVCRGLIENAPKDPKKPTTVFYIAPNETVSKQNHTELCKGFIQSTGSNSDKNKLEKQLKTRLSAINDFNIEAKYSIRSFSSSMFFNTDNSTMGTENERMIICTYLYAIFNCAKNSPCSVLKKWGNDNSIYVEMLISAFFKPTGTNSRDWYFINCEPNQDVLADIKKNYENWHKKITNNTTKIVDKEISWIRTHLEKELKIRVPSITTLLNNNPNYRTIKDIVSYPKKSDSFLVDITSYVIFANNIIAA